MLILGSLCRCNNYHKIGISQGAISTEDTLGRVAELQDRLIGLGRSEVCGETQKRDISGIQGPDARSRMWRAEG